MFEDIRDIGWIKSFRRGSTGIGYTFEFLFGKCEDCSILPDFMGIEIKTHRANSVSNICLFNCNPSGDYSYELKRIYDNYGYRSIKNRNNKVLNTSVYSNSITDVGIHYKFSLKVDYDKQRIFLMVFDRLGYFIENRSFWTFNQLKERLYMKMEYLAYVVADSKVFDGDEYFFYRSVHFYKLKDFDTFLKLIESGIIRVNFKVSGCLDYDKHIEIKNHGTDFSINPQHLCLLYDSININS